MTAPAAETPRPPEDAPPPEGPDLVVEEARFAMVPEWVLDADLPDSAFRLYVALLRYGATSGMSMPSRATLARRLHRSTDAVDRALRALEERGVVVVQRRRRAGANLTNRYFVRTTAPTSTAAAAADAAGGGRTSAATPAPTPPAERAAPLPAGRTSAATGRTSAAGVAAPARPDREVPTERTPPPPPSALSEPAKPARAVSGTAEVEAELLHDCGLDPDGGLDALAQRCAAARAAHGLAATSWRPPHLAAALRTAVRGRGWPAALAPAALLIVVSDPATRSPMRLAEAGPWWDQAAAPAASNGDPGGADAEEVDACEQRLAHLDGQRPRLQAAARAELAAEGLPLTRSTVVRRACQIHDRAAS